MWTIFSWWHVLYNVQCITSNDHWLIHSTDRCNRFFVSDLFSVSHCLLHNRINRNFGQIFELSQFANLAHTFFVYFRRIIKYPRYALICRMLVVATAMKWNSTHTGDWNDLMMNHNTDSNRIFTEKRPVLEVAHKVYEHKYIHFY